MNFLQEYSNPLNSQKDNNWDFTYLNNKNPSYEDHFYSNLPSLNSVFGWKSVFSDIANKNEDQQSLNFFDTHFDAKSTSLYNLNNLDFSQKFDLSSTKYLDFENIQRNDTQLFIPSPRFSEGNELAFKYGERDSSFNIETSNAKYNFIPTNFDFLTDSQNNNIKNDIEKINSSNLDKRFNSSNEISNYDFLQRITNLINCYQDHNSKSISNENIETMCEIIRRLIQRHYNFLQKLLLTSENLKMGSMPKNDLFAEIISVFLKFEVDTKLNSINQQELKVESKDLSIDKNSHLLKQTYKKSTSDSLSLPSETTNFRTPDNSNISYPDSENTINSLNVENIIPSKKTDATQNSLLMNFHTNPNEKNDLRLYDLTSTNMDEQLSSLLGINQNFSNKISTHEQGKCKPCAFYYNKKKGCKNGSECEFCHHEDHGKHTLKQWKKQQQKILDQNRKTEESLIRSRSTIETTSTVLPSISSYLENTTNSSFLPYIHSSLKY